jgi:hypothetical protein
MTSRDSGTVFIEALVSTAVVAAVLAALFAALQSAALHHRQIAERRDALLVAQSELAAVGTAIPVTPGALEGVDGDMRWRVRIDPPIESPLAFSRAGAPSEVTVSVGLASGDTDLVVLRTLRLADNQ